MSIDFRPPVQWHFVPFTGDETRAFVGPRLPRCTTLDPLTGMQCHGWEGHYDSHSPHIFGATSELSVDESHFEAIDRLTAPHVDTGYRYSPNDQGSFDARPDGCWRCDARMAENDLGTCNACRDDLRG